MVRFLKLKIVSFVPKIQLILQIQNAIKERYYKLLKNQLKNDIKNPCGCKPFNYHFKINKINSLSQRKCGNVIFFIKKVHLENTFSK